VPLLGCRSQRLDRTGRDAERGARRGCRECRLAPAPLDIADHYFSAVESAALTALEPSWRHLRFFEYWTLKESYIKARGMGLSIPLDKFTFSYPCDCGVVLSVDAEFGDHPDRWAFWQLGYTPITCWPSASRSSAA
jgi:phosphopantetheinyl transferase